MPQRSRKVNVALLQMRCVIDRQANLDKATGMIRDAAKAGAQVCCLPELFQGLYPCQSEDSAQFEVAESVPGPTTDALKQLAAELGVVIVASLFERRAAGLYHNTCAVLDADGTFLGKYRKLHIPDDPLYYEKFYFTPGDLGYQAFETQFVKLGTLVCWDQWFPEAARLTAMQGAELITYPTAIGWHPAERERHGADQLESWLTIQRSHAIANGCFVAAINRVGHEGAEDGGLDFWGNSFICNPAGRIVAQAPAGEEAVVVTTLDLTQVDEQRHGWPFLRDRRIDTYADLTKRFGDSP